MPILGAHKSIAGGYDRAVQRAADAGCDCVQLFTKNNNQWRAKEITPEESRRFRQALADRGILHPIAHDSYLINLASPDPLLWRKSLDAFVAELLRADTLGIPYLVTHPGCYTSGTETLGLRQIVSALDEVHAQTRTASVRCLLETTAGQGSSLGWRPEHLAEILAKVNDPERLGVCFDTCHVFAAGYPMATKKQYDSTMHLFDSTVGLDTIKAFHLNDSTRPLGARVDRHAHIGRGEMGLAPFRRLLQDPRFAEVPMYLETPKGAEDGQDLDMVNLAVLRRLAR
jgi:deoxyribonuclease IV